MQKNAFIFGAGKTGRGFAAHLAFLGGYDIVLIDKNLQLVNNLKKSGQYDIQVLGNEKMNCTIRPTHVFHIDDPSWQNIFGSTSLVFTSVFGNNFEELSGYLSTGLNKRYKENPRQVLTVITCENYSNAAADLKNRVLKKMGPEKEKWFSEKICFSESMIFRTCLDAGIDQDQLTVRAQNFFELPCDGDSLKEIPQVYGLKPLKNFGNQLRRKIYTYNCINAVITYLGAKKGYLQLYQAGNDEEILNIARQAAKETSDAQIAEFGFDRVEQEAWMQAAFEKFADKNLPDPIERNGADPERKLSRDDRLIGPALLALKYSIYPEGLLTGIIAGFDFYDKVKKISLRELMATKGIDPILNEVCGLSPGEKLVELIKEKLNHS